MCLAATRSRRGDYEETLRIKRSERGTSLALQSAVHLTPELMRSIANKTSIAALVAISFFSACSRGDTAPANDTATADPPRPALIVAPSQPYKVVAVAAPGSITGTVDFSGAIPASVENENTDPSCGKAPAGPVAHTGSKIGGVLVWLTDIRSGKPLPGTRRFELTNDHCTLDPHLQVIFTNSTLNVTSEDRVLHLDRFIDVASGKTVALAPFNDEGEVVPLDHSFTTPAEIEVICDLHPSSHAWLAVLDHPYYAMTNPAGVFTLDGVPPGKYHVRAWHPSFGIANDSVTVVAGQSASLALKLVPESSERNAPRRTPRAVPGTGFSAPRPSAGADSTAVDSTAPDSSAEDSTRAVHH